jgi:hypothetical protein
MADPAPIEVCSALLTKTEGVASNGSTAETATTLTADDILLLADGPAGSLKGPHWLEPPVLGRRREGPETALSGPRARHSPELGPTIMARLYP